MAARPAKARIAFASPPKNGRARDEAQGDFYLAAARAKKPRKTLPRPIGMAARAKNPGKTFALPLEMAARAKKPGTCFGLAF